MSRKFNPDDLKNPVYEYSQVITERDLQTIYKSVITQYNYSQWWEFKHRYDLIIARSVVGELLSWLHSDKPTLSALGDIE